MAEVFVTSALLPLDERPIMSDDIVSTARQRVLQGISWRW
jgi:hypothetical protein